MLRLAIAAAAVWLLLPGNALAGDVVISQVYGGGGNTGATLKNDYVELFNRSATAASLDGWSIQYASATGTGSFGGNPVAALSGALQPGQRYLVQLAGGTTGAGLPAADASGTANLSGSSGKVALVTSTTGLACNGGSITCTPAQLAQIADLVGYGTANFYEGTSAAPTLSVTTAALRADGGCVDTNQNGADFTAGTPSPRNTLSPPTPCGGVVDTAPTVASIVPADGATGVAVDAAFTVTFSEAVTVSDGAFTLACDAGGARPLTVTGGPSVYTVRPTADLKPSDRCVLTVHGDRVLDQDVPLDAMAGNATSTFTVVEGCGSPITPIPAIQGAGPTAAVTGTVSTEGVVVGDYEGPSPALRGFYLQDPAGDGNTATSDGIFVYEPTNANAVSLGDVVRVSGSAGDSFDQTQITASSVTVCSAGTGTVAPTDVTLPFTDASVPERYEGMLVRLPQTLSVTEHYQLGRYGEVLLSAGGRLYQPTSLVAPGAPALALQAQNDLDKVLLDDGSNEQNPDPIVFGRGGQPLSAINTLRGGDTAAGIVGVLAYEFGAYMVEPIHALGGTATFQPANPRPAGPPQVGGSLRVAGMNLLNFFNTFSGCTNGVAGAATDCRGANDAAEFARQWPKTVAAITGTGADVVGIVEMENDGYGPDSAIAFLVDRLNAATAPGTYAYVDVDTATGQTNALGTDAIKVGVLYKPGRVTPVGQTAALNSEAFVNGGDSAPRNRPALAQAFRENATGETFVLSVNHLKSKGSACALPDQLDGQSNCAAVRTNAATLLADWLKSDPTGTGAGTLIVGDLNSYAKEDPITAFAAGGFENLIASKLGAQAYSYVFDGQWGYLDYALGGTGIVPDVTGVGEWHINADEPSVLDYNVEYKTAGLVQSLYAPDQYRISDHDPVLVGLDLHPTVAGLEYLVGRYVTKNDGLRNSLLVKLAHGSYDAFANEVRAQTGKALTAEQARTLLDRVARL